jgi:hypothetical protein
VRLGGEVAVRRVVGQGLGIGVAEVVDRVAQGAGGRGVRTVLVADGGAELLGEPRDEVRARRVALRLRVDLSGQPRRREGHRDRGEVPERLVERGDLEVRRVPEIRAHGVQHGVTLLVGHHVGARPIDEPARLGVRLLKKLSALRS